MVGLLFKCSNFFPRKILILIYNSFINSKITYCLESWGSAPETYLSHLHILQKRLVRIIHKKPAMTHTKPLFINSSILPIHQLYKYKLLQIAYKIFHSKQSHTDDNYSTRASQHNLKLPLSTTAAGHRGVSYRCASLWNVLPGLIRDVSVEGEFRYALKSHLLGGI